MPLTSRGRAETRRPRRASNDAVVLAASAGCLVAIAAAAATWWLTETQRLSQEMVRYGEALAEDVALLAAEPLRRDDRIGLGLVVARLVARGEVRGIAIHTELDQPFVVVGSIASPQGVLYRKGVLAQGVAIGQVRVALNPANFRPAATSHLIFGAVAIVALLSAFGAGCALARASSWKSRGSSAPAGAEHAAAEPAPALQAAEQSQYGVVANLFHRASMADDDRRSALRLALEAAQRAAERYGGEAVPLARVGAVMMFAGSGEHRAFDAVCAGLVLREVLGNPAIAAPGLFRFGVDSIPAFPGVIEQGQRDELVLAESQHDIPALAPGQRDVLLLSSLAPNGELAIGKGAHAMLATTALEIAPLGNQVVQALAPTAPRGVVLAVGDKRQAARLTRQAAEIAAALEEERR